MNTNIDNESKAHIIAEALPHIQKYRKKTIVVKYGGNAMINDELKEAVMRDLVLLTTVGIKVVLVHGGGPAINKTLDKIGVESKFVDGLRVTDKETVDVVQMVLAGKVNKGPCLSNRQPRRSCNRTFRNGRKYDKVQTARQRARFCR